MYKTSFVGINVVVIKVGDDNVIVMVGNDYIVVIFDKVSL